MVNIFMLLTNIDGEPEEIDLGSLYVDHDANGFIRHIAVEPYDFTKLEQYEAHFDSFDDVPEVPLCVRMGPDEAFVCGFFNLDGIHIDLESIREDPPGKFRDLEIKQYELIVRAAYRLYERAVRGEAAFVGYTDQERHRRLSIRDILKVALPLRPRYLPPGERREALRERRRAEAAERARTLRRVFLHAELEVSTGFPGAMVLDVCTRPDGCPHRVGRILGVTDTGQPLVVTEDGDLRISDTDGFFTNLMACEMEPGVSVFVWTDHCQKSQIFRIDRAEVLINAEDPQDVQAVPPSSGS
jgi:hypothetical protein